MLVSLNIKDEDAVLLVTEVARRTGRSKTATIRDLARAELDRLDADAHDRAVVRARELTAFFEAEIWHGEQEPLGKDEVERILGLR